MSSIIFIEAGDGDPEHRFENASLQLYLSKEIEDLGSTRFMQIRPGQMEPALYLGTRNHYGLLLGGPAFLHDLKPSLWDIPGLAELSGRRFEIGVGEELFALAREMNATGHGLHIIDTTSPTHRYRILGKLRTDDDCDEQVRYVMGDRLAAGEPGVILDGLSVRSTEERRFFFVNGELITDSPVAWGLQDWRHTLLATGEDPDTWHTKGVFDAEGGGDAGITRDERALALEIAQLTGIISGYIDIGMTAHGRPVLIGFHQGHAGDYSLFGADIEAIAKATATHCKDLLNEVTAEPASF